jgi:hypothetical protein
MAAVTKVGGGDESGGKKSVVFGKMSVMFGKQMFVW